MQHSAATGEIKGANVGTEALALCLTLIVTITIPLSPEDGLEDTAWRRW
jgi:hypothetical protein